MASNCFKQTKSVSRKNTSNNPWFNWQTRLAKRELKKATNATSKFPTSEFLRHNFYRVKKSYKKLLSRTKNVYFENLNKDIEDGKILNWQAFKKLKKQKTSKTQYDSHDMKNFQSFFEKLYSDNHKTINSEKKDKYLKEADNINNTATYPADLNEKISMSEVVSTIKSLKSGKASSMDMISNEILKSLDVSHLEFIIKLFDKCLDCGIYPWNENIITPLHKNGKKSNPDNYRAIAVSSAIGKLFSTILLDRLTKFRKDNCPDPPNQLGFTKGAQTYDHILTMQTISSKYKKLHRPVYAVFVDFKKAFDSVCRQALLYKIAKLGITGKYFNVLKNMYTNSHAHIKLMGHLSEQFKISKGTEQGHPLSPELFKIFLYDLSKLLDVNDCPILSTKNINHLLWADDLIMLSMSPKSSQLQLDKLGEFCNEWGLEVNEIKTQVMIFRKNSENFDQSLKFMLLGKPLEIVNSYCYLGIVLHYSGELRTAQKTLQTKSMRAFFGLKRNIIRSKLSFKSVTTLFDSLIKPIVLYGAPIWTPESAIIKSIIKYTTLGSQTMHNFISKINRTYAEKVHISFLKWALGVHRKGSNIGVWGETGRYPLIYQSIRLTLNYYNHLLQVPRNSFVYAALKEQKNMRLPWFRNIEPLLKLDEIFHMDHVSAYHILSKKIQGTKSDHNMSTEVIHNVKSSLSKIKPLPSEKFRVQTITSTLINHFIKCWEYEKSCSSKLSFYHTNKMKFAREVYLDDCKSFSQRYSTTKLRISAHNLEIERGRYSNTQRSERICKWCNTSMGLKILEDENHMLFECDLYADLRAKLISQLNKSPPIHDSISNVQSLNINISTKTLKSSFMKLLSPYTVINLNDSPTNALNIHHKTLLNKNLKCPSPEVISSIHRRSYILNCISTFVCRAFIKRQNHEASLKENLFLQKTITINF